MADQKVKHIFCNRLLELFFVKQRLHKITSR